MSASHTTGRFWRRTLLFWVVAGLGGGVLGVTLGALLGAAGPAESGFRATHRFTPGALALANLDALIEGQREALERRPALGGVRASLVAGLLQRASFSGRVSDLDEAWALANAPFVPTEAGVAPAPGPADLLLRAKVLGALHRFEEALDALEQAEEMGADAEAVHADRDIVLVALGRELPAIAARRARARLRYPSRETYVAQAAVLAALGRMREADDALERALHTSADVSPLPAAMILFQRGVLAAEHRGDAQSAEQHYRDALELLPTFVRAHVHLAELEAARGDRAAAETRLEGVLDAEDPEPLSRLAGMVSDPRRAATLRSRAEERYAALLRSHRAAFLDHALEFHIEHGSNDSEQAQRLAAELVAARPVPRSFQLALRVASSRGDRALACELAAAAHPLRNRHPVLAAELAELVSVGCP